MTKKQRERRHDKFGPLTKMAEADGWVMVRRPRAAPFAITVKDWKLAGEAASEDPGYSRSLETRMIKMGTDLPGGTGVSIDKEEILNGA